MLLGPSTIHTQNVVDWIQDRATIAETSDSLGASLYPIRIPGAISVAITATLESLILGLCSLIALGPTSVKWALDSMKAEGLARKISDEYTFAHCWDTLSKAIRIGSYSILGSGVILLNPEWGVSIYYWLLPAIQAAGEAASGLSGHANIARVLHVSQKIAHGLLGVPKAFYQIVRYYPRATIAVTGVLALAGATRLDLTRYKEWAVAYGLEIPIPDALRPTVDDLTAKFDGMRLLLDGLMDSLFASIHSTFRGTIFGSLLNMKIISSESETLDSYSSSGSLSPTKLGQDDSSSSWEWMPSLSWHTPISVLIVTPLSVSADYISSILSSSWERVKTDPLAIAEFLIYPLTFAFLSLRYRRGIKYALASLRRSLNRIPKRRLEAIKNKLNLSPLGTIETLAQLAACCDKLAEVVAQLKAIAKEPDPELWESAGEAIERKISDLVKRAAILAGLVDKDQFISPIMKLLEKLETIRKDSSVRMQVTLIKAIQKQCKAQVNGGAMNQLQTILKELIPKVINLPCLDEGEQTQLERILANLPMT